MKLTDTDLLAIIRSHRSDSLGSVDGELTNKRAKAMDHYHGRPYGNEVEGRSAVVSRDLAEAVDWAMPSIIRTFIQSGLIAEFDPIGPEDEALAQQESDYINTVIMRDNNGFMVLHDAFKDTMLLKNGYVKHFWEEKEKVSSESYTGLTIDQVSKILSDLEADGAEVSVTGQEIKTVPIPGMAEPMNQATAIMAPQTMELFDIKLQIKRKSGKCVVIPVPSEEVRVSKKCRGSLQDAPFVEHVTRKTRSELIEMGMSRDFVDNLPAYNERDTSVQTNSRDSTTDESDSFGSSIGDKSMDEIDFCEAYIRVDFDDDGIAELRKVVTVANKIPSGEQWNEVIEAVPLTGFVVKRVPHRHIGESLDDDLSDLQEIKTALFRQLLDNVYYINNSEMIINERANVKDFLTSMPGGIKRVKGVEPIGDSVHPVVKASILDKVLPVIDHLDRVKESRTGITKASTGMDPDVLRESTKGAFMENLNRASQKIEMMTRLLAEGVKEMVLQVHAIILRHQDRNRMVKMRGEWVNVNPQEWRERTELTVKVGLGTGNEAEKREKLMLIATLQEKLHAMGMVGPEQAYSLFEDIAKTLGFDVPGKYVMTPNSPEFQQAMQSKQGQPNPEILKIQEQGKVTLMAKQAELKVQAENDARDGDRQMQKYLQDAALKREQMAADDAKHAREMEFKRWEKSAEIAADLEKARMEADARINSAQLSAGSILTPQQEFAADAAVGDEGGEYVP